MENLGAIMGDVSFRNEETFKPFQKNNKLYGARDFKNREPKYKHDKNFTPFEMVI